MRRLIVTLVMAIYRCQQVNGATGELCNATFPRAWNLKRHEISIHQSVKRHTFITWTPAGSRRETPELASGQGRATDTLSPFAKSPSPSGESSLSVPFSGPAPASTNHEQLANVGFGHAGSQTTGNSQRVTASSAETMLTLAPSASVDDWLLNPDPACKIGPQSTCITDDDSNGESSPTARSSSPAELSGTSTVGTKRKRSSITVARHIESCLKDQMPKYMVKQSKKSPNQQRGLNWMTNEGKVKFDKMLKHLTACWGVKPDHKSTCVLCPEDWRFLDPLQLAALTTAQNCPLPGLPRAWYTYADHATSIARARAWFAEWPRTGLEHDNFLGCGPFKPMDASHLCHHDHCILHVVYEPANLNQDRKECCKEARFLRSEGREVPDSCTRHAPPCMMQVRDDVPTCTRVSVH